MDYNSISIKPYIKSHLELQREITLIELVPSKAVVGVDRPMKAISMHIRTPYKRKLSKFSLLSFCQKLFFLKQNPSCICSTCLHCIGKV